ncbi:MAG: transposase [Desulfarculaceae bacterium]|nr:transposase [Desulfarculaceae bacterium]
MKLNTSLPFLGQAFFITFSCYKNRRLLNRENCKQIVMNELGAAVAKYSAACLGFVVMPDHVHTLLHLTHQEQLASLMQRWKRLSSFRIKKHLIEAAPDYFPSQIRDDPIWKHRYYCFPVVNEKKAEEKIDYMHQNPVRAGLVTRAEEWEFGSARFYLLAENAGVPINWPG